MRWAVGLLVLSLGWSLSALASEKFPAPAEELARPLFEPPAAGTYELPAIRRVRDRELLGVDGKPAPLLGLGRGQVAVVSFIYRSCADHRGCPAALATLRKLDRELARYPDLAARTRLVTVSFDPERDTPEHMAMLGELMEPRGDWRFLTAPGVETIAPILEEFDQDILRVVTEEGAETPLIAHLLKVFLVDHEGAVRNVYGASFLDWRVVLNDVRTLTGAAP